MRAYPVSCGGREAEIAAAFGVTFYPLAKVREELSLPSAYRWALRLFGDRAGEI